MALTLHISPSNPYHRTFSQELQALGYTCLWAPATEGRPRDWFQGSVIRCSAPTCWSKTDRPHRNHRGLRSHRRPGSTVNPGRTDASSSQHLLSLCIKSFVYFSRCAAHSSTKLARTMHGSSVCTDPLTAWVTENFKASAHHTHTLTGSNRKPRTPPPPGHSSKLRERGGEAMQHPIQEHAVRTHREGW